VAGTRKLVIEIVGNAKDASKAFGDVRSDSDKTKAHMDKFGTAALGAGVAIAGGLGVAVGQFIEADAESRKLDNSIANSTETFTANGDALRDIATATQNKTGADGDAIVGMQALLVQYGLNEEQVGKLTPLVNDLSMKMGISLEAAGKAVAKSINGSNGALKKMGIVLDETKQTGDPLVDTMAALQGSVAGFGEEIGGTAAGKVAIMKQQLGDLVEAVGGGAVDLFTPLVDGMSGLLAKTGGGSTAVGDFVGKLGGVAGVSLLAVGGLVKVKGAVDSAKASLTNASGGLNNFGKAAKGIGLAVGGISAAFAVYEIGKAINDATKDAVGFKTALDDLVTSVTLDQQIRAVNDAVNTSKGTFDSLGRTILNDESSARHLWVTIGDVNTNVGSLEQALADAAKSGDMEALDALLKAIDATAQGDSESIAGLNSYMDKYRNLVGSAAKRTKEGAAAHNESADATEGETSALKEYSDQLRAMADPFFAVMNAEQASTKAKNDAAAAQAKVTQLQRAGKTGTDEYRTALTELQGANIGSAQSAIGLQGSLLTLADGVRNGTVSAASFSGQLDKMYQSGQISKATMEQLKGSLGRTAGSAELAAQKALGVTAAVKSVPGSAKTTFTAETGTYQRRIDQIRNTLRSIGVLSPAGRAALEAEAGVRTLFGEASGGPVHKGLPYLVGERGPEIVVPGSGYVIPNRKLVQAGAPSGGGGMVTINVTAGVGDPAAIGRTVVEAIRQYERTSGTSWRN